MASPTEELMRKMSPQEVREKSNEFKKSHIADGMTAFGQLMTRLRDIGRVLRVPQSMMPAEGDDDDTLEKKYKSIEDALKVNPSVDNFVQEWAPNKANLVARTLRRIMIDGEFDESMLKPLQNGIGEHFENEMLAIQRAPMEEALSSEMLKYLPPRLLVEVDPDGKIESVSDLFANDIKTVEVKMDHMVKLIDKYNFIVERVKADLASPDLETRMKACIVMIILETGIRPGNVGESNLKDENGKEVRVNGKPIRVETFGASGLKHNHIKRILHDAVELEFRGKASTINRARVTTPEVVEIIKELAETAEVREMYLYTEGFMFANKKDVVVTDDSVRAYFKKIAGGSLVPTDFRKLRATQVLFDSLKKQQRKLLSRIRTFAEQESENLAERVAQEVSATINNAISEAQTAISHSDTKVTISQYLNPLVVMKYLESGGLMGQLKDAVMTNPTHLKFDPQVFIDRAMGNVRTASFFRFAFLGWGKKANLMSLVDELEDSLSEKSSSLLDSIERLEDSLEN